MKILFVAGPATSGAFGLSPLAIAARERGHQAIMATTEDVLPAALSVGIPAFSATDRSMNDLLVTDRRGAPLVMPTGPEEQEAFVGGMFGRHAADMLPRLNGLLDHWLPDLIVGSPHAYAAPLLASRFGLPWVRHMLTGNQIDREGVHPGVVEELAPELETSGGLPDPDLVIDIFPDRLRPSIPSSPTLFMRWTPTNQQVPIEPWMLVRGSRPRVLVTAGSLATKEHSSELLSVLTHAFADLDAEVLLAGPKHLEEPLRGTLKASRFGWIPMDLVIPTCDLVVHHSGTMTAMTALYSGVPQLLVPQETKVVSWASTVAALGAALTVRSEEATPALVTNAGRELLEDASYGENARTLARDIAQLPSPAEALDSLDRITP